MIDVVNSETRSRMMSHIRNRDTRPELALRKALHALGFRYRLHVSRITGRPDMALCRYRAVIFVHGCFWHRHEGCRFSTVPVTRPEFWKAKFEANVRRDSVVRKSLMKEGWRVATIWECSLRGSEQAAATAKLLAVWLLASTPTIEIGAPKASDAVDEILNSASVGSAQMPS